MLNSMMRFVTGDKVAAVLCPDHWTVVPSEHINPVQSGIFDALRAELNRLRASGVQVDKVQVDRALRHWMVTEEMRNPKGEWHFDSFDGVALETVDWPALQ